MHADAVHHELESIFRDIVAEEIVLTDDLTADDVEAWDSLTHVNLIFAIEEHFGIEFTQEEMSRMANAGELKARVLAKVSG